MDVVSSNQILEVAQQMYNKGDDAGTLRILAREEMSFDDLGPRLGGPDFEERVTACRTEYRERRDKAIKDLMRGHEWNREKATNFFDGKLDRESAEFYSEHKPQRPGLM